MSTSPRSMTVAGCSLTIQDRVGKTALTFEQECGELRSLLRCVSAGDVGNGEVEASRRPRADG